MSRHQVAFERFGNILHRRLEGIERCFTLAGQPYLDEELHRIAEKAGIEHSAIPFDKALIFQRLEASMAGGGGKPHQLAQHLHAFAAIGLEGAQKLAIHGIDLHTHCLNPLYNRMIVQ